MIISIMLSNINSTTDSDSDLVDRLAEVGGVAELAGNRDGLRLYIYIYIYIRPVRLLRVSI